MRIATILLLITIYSSAFSQSTFEKLIEWDTNINCMGIKAEELTSGEFVFQVNNSSFSFPTMKQVKNEKGAGLIKISNNGEVIWKKPYHTTFADVYISSRDFTINSQNVIIMPLTIFVGETILSTPPFYTYHFRPSFLSINLNNGNVLDTTFIGVDTISESSYYIEDVYPIVKEYNDTLYVESHISTYQNNIKTYDLNLEELSSIMVDTLFYEREFDKLNKRIIANYHRQIHFYDLETNIKYNLQIAEWDTILPDNIRYDCNIDYFVVSFCDYTNDLSGIHIFDHQNNLVEQVFIPNDQICDIAITDNNRIFALKQSPQYLDSIPHPLIISEYDINLNEIASKDYGFELVVPSKIYITSDNCLLVCGTQNTTIATVKNKSVEEIAYANNKLYILKDKLENFGISEPVINQIINIYPNPGNNELNIVGSSIIDNSQLSIYDCLGNMHFTTLIQNKKTQTIITQNLKPGIYFIVIYNKDEVISNMKWVKI